MCQISQLQSKLCVDKGEEGGPTDIFPQIFLAEEVAAARMKGAVNRIVGVGRVENLLSEDCRVSKYGRLIESFWV